jgi:hypothetical protein
MAVKATAPSNSRPSTSPSSRQRSFSMAGTRAASAQLQQLHVNAVGFCCDADVDVATLTQIRRNLSTGGSSIMALTAAAVQLRQMQGIVDFGGVLSSSTSLSSSYGGGRSRGSQAFICCGTGTLPIASSPLIPPAGRGSDLDNIAHLVQLVTKGRPLAEALAEARATRTRLMGRSAADTSARMMSSPSFLMQKQKLQLKETRSASLSGCPIGRCKYVRPAALSMSGSAPGPHHYDTAAP